MNKNGVKNQIISGLMWRFLERCGAHIVSFVVSIVLARLIAPTNYGVISLTSVFISISQVFVDSGLANALIQKKEVDDLDYSSVFFLNVFVCVILYMALFFISPLIAKFFGNDLLKPVLRVLGLTLIISALKNVQQAYVSRNMLFKKFFFSTLAGTIFAAIVGIVMAYAGLGVWALVAQQLINLLVDTLVLWMTVRWRPTKAFSLVRLKALFSYGWKMLASTLLNSVYNNLRQLIIGKMYTSSDLAYYNKGQSLPILLVSNINTSIDSVLFPVMSQEQNDGLRLKNMTRQSIKISSYLMWPVMMGLLVIAPSLIRLLLTETWISAAPYMQIYCIILAFEPIQTANLNAIKAMGRSDLFLRLEIIKKSIGLLILIISMHFGVLAIAGSLLIYSFVAQMINSFPNKKLLNYSYFEQLKDISPSIILSVMMVGVIYPVRFLQIGDFFRIIIQIFVGAVFYLLGSMIMRIDMFFYLQTIIFKDKKK